MFVLRKAFVNFNQAILLVGGLGASWYPFKRLQAVSDGIQIRQP